MDSRRSSLNKLVVLSVAMLMAALLCCAEPTIMPEEGVMHTRTYMSIASSVVVWGEDLDAIHVALATLADTIARFEPVTLFTSAKDEARVRQLITHSNVEIHLNDVDDLWMRDTSCLFTYTGCSSSAECASTHTSLRKTPMQCVGFNFNGWGGKQNPHDNDARVAEAVARDAGVPFLRSNLTIEGGGIEVDGEGTAIATESCILNSNRNDLAVWDKAAVEAEFLRTLGIRKVVWTAGVKDKDITDGHIDFYARFVKPGVVVAAQENDATLFDYDATREVIRDLRAATDVHGNALDVRIINNPTQLRPRWASNDFAASYINYYLVNGGVIAPEFGDAIADAEAKKTLQDLYPNREVVMLNIDPIAFGGGGIHCSTQQQPVGETTQRATVSPTAPIVGGSRQVPVSRELLMFAVVAAFFVAVY